MRSLLFSVVLAGAAYAQTVLYGQCGGIGFSGSTTCVSGATCTVINAYYSQCLPGSATTTTGSGGGTTPTATTSIPVATATGVVKASSGKFQLNGSPFYFAGTNAYWLPMLTNTEDVDAALDAVAAAGLRVLRIWGFSDSTSNDGSTTVFQTWSGSTPTVNTGTNGLQRIDYIVAGARSRGIRLIITLSNNWSDYGGMDLYVNQMSSGSAHDAFYTNSNIQNAYKNYVKTVIGRYSSSEPAIFAWELANEPRCAGTLSASSSCTPSTLTTWINTMSTYIKSIDSGHMVAVGDEGFFNWSNTTDYLYAGSPGGDHNAYLALSNIDFGTFHMYPESWGETLDWGNTWIEQHAYAALDAKKPTILEEYGVTRSSGERDTYIPEWHTTALSNAINGDMYWQFGLTLPVTGKTSDDGNTIFTTDSDYQTLVVQYAAKFDARTS